jgi:L-rhamnose-H+ transport protein
MTSLANGLALLIAAGVLNACFTLPMKSMRRWSWENTWFAWTIFALLLLPSLIAWTTVPRLGQVYHAASVAIILEVVAFGLGWGTALVFFGVAAEEIGIALTFSISLGTAAAAGTLVPLLELHADQLHTPAAQGALLGVALLLAGVLACAIAGRWRERALKLSAGSGRHMTRGLVLAFLSGCGGSFVNLALTFGAPLAKTARLLGAGRSGASNAIWLVLMLAGAVPNLLYCLWLMGRNRSGGKFPAGGFHHWVLAFVMGAFWFFSTLFYGIATVELGAFGPILGWPLFMSLIVISASLLGMFTGEWKNAGPLPVRIQWAGVALLIFASFILARASELPS